MDIDDTSAIEGTRRCCLCLRIFSSVTETRGALASPSICFSCNVLFLGGQTRYNNSLESVESMLSQQLQDLQPTNFDNVNQSRQWTRVLSETESGGFDSWDGGIFPYAAYESDSDASVNVDTSVNHNDDSFVNHDDDNDDHNSGRSGNDETEVVENTSRSFAGRIRLHRSLATNGRNRPIGWLSEILSDEGTRNSEGRLLFGILEDQLLEPSGYGDPVDVVAHGSQLGAPPAALWFVQNLELMVVDEPGSVCVICKDNVGVGSVVNQLPCGHVYHPSCIVPWLNARNTCPLCRYELPTDDMNRRCQESEAEVRDAFSESGGGRWRFMVAALVSVLGIGVVLWLGGSVWWSER